MRIVIVDDEEIIRRGMLYLLQQLELEVKIVGEARNGQDGLLKIEQLQPDYAFIDIHMPLMNGIELIRQLHTKQSAPKTKCVIITAHSEFEYARQAVRYGVSDFLLKPLDENILLDLFHRLEKPQKAMPVAASISADLISSYIQERDVSNPLVKDVLHYLGNNYMRNIQLQELAASFDITPNYISAVFKRVTGDNLITFLNQLRIEIAKLLLLEKQHNVSEIAYMVGYNNIAYFDRVFKTMTGMTPMEYYRQLPAKLQP